MVIYSWLNLTIITEIRQLLTYKFCSEYIKINYLRCFEQFMLCKFIPEKFAMKGVLNILYFKTQPCFSWHFYMSHFSVIFHNKKQILHFHLFQVYTKKYILVFNMIKIFSHFENIHMNIFMSTVNSLKWFMKNNIIVLSWFCIFIYFSFLLCIYTFVCS